MEKFQSFIERVMPRSAFGLTMLTIASSILVCAFFIRGIHLVSINGDSADGDCLADRNLINKSILLREGESYSTRKIEGVVESEDEPCEGSEEGTDFTKLTPSPERSVPVKPSGRYSSNPGLLPTVSPGYVALLLRTCDCRWAENSKAPKEGAQFKVGQTLNLAAGLVEIAFGCGAKAILEGPAVLELESSKSGSLRIGKLTANVPDEVEGFTVHTPTTEVVSLCASAPKSVAKLTSTADCLWAEGNAVTKEGASLLPGQAVKLVGGLAEITFASGAKVILQGPANFEIESSKTATLHSGRITADVPDDLEGFRIRTSAAEILSLPAEESKGTKSKVAKDVKLKAATKR